MNPVPQKYFSDRQVALLLGMRTGSVRRWRQKNKAAGELKYGPPYEYRGANVVYPVEAFRRWCSQTTVKDGVVCWNMPLSTPLVTTKAGADEAVVPGYGAPPALEPELV